ncbi:unnamed protein product [Rotaria sp. Silwood1]|nr:unnamed protein product [Rotaria sp. Silwood1]CAF5178436.1 unnamed protein product [Rotaria sp. Silwood1]
MDSTNTVVYDEPKLYNHNHTDNFNLIREITENPSINPTVMTTDQNDNNESGNIFLALLSSSSNDSNIE